MFKRSKVVAATTTMLAVAAVAVGGGASPALAMADSYAMYCTPHSGGGTCVEVYIPADGGPTVFHTYWYDNNGGWGQNW